MQQRDSLKIYKREKTNETKPSHRTAHGPEPERLKITGVKCRQHHPAQTETARRLAEEIAEGAMKVTNSPALRNLDTSDHYYSSNPALQCFFLCKPSLRGELEYATEFAQSAQSRVALPVCHAPLSGRRKDFAYRVRDQVSLRARDRFARASRFPANVGWA